MKNIFEASELPINEKVFLKKDYFGYRVVQPYKNEDGTINWFNLLTGGKKNIILTILLIAIFLLYYFGTVELIGNYKSVADNPCSFCTDCQTHVKSLLYNLSINNTPKIEVIKWPT